MIRLFTMDHAPSSRSTTFNKMNYITSRCAQNLTHALKQHRFSNKAVPSNHPLVTILNSMHVPLSATKERFIELADNSYEAVAAALAIGTSIAPPRIDKAGWFYGTPEIHFVYKDEVARNKLPKWFDIVPVKVFHHNRTDITYTLLDGRPNTAEDNVAIIGIDIGMLLLMYRGWRHWQQSVNPDAQMTIPQFIANWVLPTMITSHNTVAWRNLLQAQVNGTPVAKSKKPEPSGMVSVDKYLDELSIDVALSISSSGASYVDQLKIIPQLYETTSWDDSRQPDYSYTRNANLSKMFTTMSWMYTLLTLNQLVDKTPNTNYDAELLRFLDRYSAGRWASRGAIKLYMDNWVNELLLPLIKV